jgi:FkbM family methyltransferase
MAGGSFARGPLSAQLKRVAGLRPTDVKRLLAWRSRIRRDTSAMREIITRELGPRDAAVDVGAHAGEITAWLVATAPEGAHVAVEPLPAFAEHLREQFPDVAVHECALSDHDGTTTFFNVVGSPAWSGLHRQDPVAGKETVEIDVAIRRLDDVVGEQTVRLVKIDVEGAELGVFAGGRRTIERDRPVLLFEHARVHATPFGTAPGDVWTLLDELDYSVAPIADGAQVLDRAGFVALCEVSHAGGYDRHAVTNWVARPR